MDEAAEVEQAKGEDPAAEIEAERTFCNQIHEARDLAVHQVGLRAMALQREVQHLAEERWRIGGLCKPLIHSLSTMGMWVV
ncbi:MAG: hypothetical protein JW718_07750 [Desulfovibrionaceae bacterium]|nr:hypothetical protein [Desulfovibrionaceae bacterium]